MKKCTALTQIPIVCLITILYLLDYILLKDSLQPFSIGSIISNSNHWIRHWHVLIVGFLPIYVALMIFGTGMVGVFLGNSLQRWFARFFTKQNPTSL